MNSAKDIAAFVGGELKGNLDTTVSATASREGYIAPSNQIVTPLAATVNDIISIPVLNLNTGKYDAMINGVTPEAGARGEVAPYEYTPSAIAARISAEHGITFTPAQSKFVDTAFTASNSAATQFFNTQDAARAQIPEPLKSPLGIGGELGGRAWYNVPGALYSLSETVQNIIGDTSKSAYGAVSGLPSVLGYYANLEIGLGSALASTVPFILSTPYAVAWSGSNPKKVPSKAWEIATGMVGSVIETEKAHPGSAIGTIAGMLLSGKAMDFADAKISAVVSRVSPVGVSTAEIITPSGAPAKITSLYTKDMFSPVESGKIVASAITPARSEASMIMSSKSMVSSAENIKFVEGRVPSFTSVKDAVDSFTRASEKEGTYMHATNEPDFIQSLIQNKGVTVGPEGSPLYFASADSVIARFLKGGENSPAIVRMTETPKTPAEALAFTGKPTAPELSPGLYPGTQPLSGVEYKGSLQQEFIVPAGTYLSVKDVSYIEAGGAKIPVIDVSIGKSGIIDSASLIAKQFKYRANASFPPKLPKFEIGSPVNALRSMDIKMPNPLEEVSAKQWSPSQKLAMRDYLEIASSKPGADAGLKTIVAGQKAIPLFREVNFVQREPVGEILAGRELSSDTISKIFANRESFGEDLVSGGSTSIRANLGDAFFGKDVIGDIDAWTEGSRKTELQASELEIIKADQPSAVISRSQIRIEGTTKPLTEVHSFEEWPAVRQPSNISTLEAVGGSKVTGPSTGFFGGLRKSSAMFDKQSLRQQAGGEPSIEPSPKNIKHAVGTSAVAKESASLFYGRDSAATGMKQSFSTGLLMEKYANSIDEMLSKTKGEARSTVEKYQGSIRTNPLELPETRAAKAVAYARENPSAAVRMLGVGIPEIRRSRPEYYPASEPVASKTSRLPAIIPIYPGSNNVPTTASAQAIALYNITPAAGPDASQYPIASPVQYPISTTPSYQIPTYPITQPGNQQYPSQPITRPPEHPPTTPIETGRTPGRTITFKEDRPYGFTGINLVPDYYHKKKEEASANKFQRLPFFRFLNRYSPGEGINIPLNERYMRAMPGLPKTQHFAPKPYQGSNPPQKFVRYTDVFKAGLGIPSMRSRR
jgi:hypothetical protein